MPPASWSAGRAPGRPARNRRAPTSAEQSTPTRSRHVQSATSSYTLDFSFPVSYPDQQPLTDFLTHERDQEVEYAQMYAPSNRPSPYEFKATGTAYRSGTAASGSQRLVFRIANDTGAANEGRPATSYTAFNYDPGKGAPITFDTLFKPGTKPVDVQHELEKRGVAVLPSFNDFGVHGSQNFAITDDAVIFFFDHDFLHEGQGKSQCPAQKSQHCSHSSGQTSPERGQT